jgi:hypothetical protein
LCWLIKSSNRRPSSGVDVVRSMECRYLILTCGCLRNLPIKCLVCHCVFVYLVLLCATFIIFIHMHLASHLGPRDADRARDVVPPTRCSRWTTQGRMDLTSGCSPSECPPSKHYLSVKLKASPGLCITCYLCYFTTLIDCRIGCALKCRSCLKA